MKTEQIVYSAPSEIHGTGLFAQVKIKKGDYIGTYKGPQAKRNGTYVLWVYHEDGRVEGRRGLNILRYLNHDERCNAEFDGFDLYAKKAIHPHQEITIDYNSA